MKYLLILSLLAISNLFHNAQAALIGEIQLGVDAYASSVTGNFGDYFDQSFNTPGDYSSPISDAQLAAAVTGSDLTTYARTFDANLTTDPNYVNDRYIDLSFGDTLKASNGAGADLVLFFAGNATNFKDGHLEKYLFSFEAGGINSGLLGITTPLGVTTSETSDIYNGDFFASYALIDLSDFGIADNAAIDDFRIYMGDSSMPSLAAAGAYNTTVVPLPLSWVLFGSGLAMLSLFRRKTRA